MQVILCPPFPLSTRRASVAGLSDTGRPFPVPHREHVFCRHCGENFRQPNLGIVPYRDACQCHPTDTRRLRGIGLVSPNALSSVAISQFRAALESQDSTLITSLRDALLARLLDFGHRKG